MIDYIRAVQSRIRLNRLGFKQRKDFFFPDGMGGKLRIDRLILGQREIYLMIDMPYEGNIFCADNIDEWTQLIKGKSFTFENPLNHLDIIINTIAGSIPVPVCGYLYFGHRASFPKGRPARVLRYDSLPEALLPPRKSEPEQAVVDAWNDLIARGV